MGADPSLSSDLSSDDTPPSTVLTHYALPMLGNLSASDGHPTAGGDLSAGAPPRQQHKDIDEGVAGDVVVRRGALSPEETSALKDSAPAVTVGATTTGRKRV